MSSRTIIPVPKIEEDGYDWYAKHEGILKMQAETQFELVFVKKGRRGIAGAV